jgi:hypothetical protein
MNFSVPTSSIRPAKHWQGSKLVFPCLAAKNLWFAVKVSKILSIGTALPQNKAQSALDKP